MQITTMNAHATAAGNHVEQHSGAIVERSRVAGEDGTMTFSKTLTLPNGKTMTSERVMTRDENGFSMHFDKWLPNGRHVVIDVTKTNAVEEVNENEEIQPEESVADASAEEPAADAALEPPAVEANVEDEPSSEQTVEEDPLADAAGQIPIDANMADVVDALEDLASENIPTG